MLDEQVSLPDGSTAKIGPERLKLPESLFYPELIVRIIGPFVILLFIIANISLINSRNRW